MSKKKSRNKNIRGSQRESGGNVSLNEIHEAVTEDELLQKENAAENVPEEQTAGDMVSEQEQVQVQEEEDFHMPEQYELPPETETHVEPATSGGEEYVEVNGDSDGEYEVIQEYEEGAIVSDTEYFEEEPRAEKPKKNRYEKRKKNSEKNRSDSDKGQDKKKSGKKKSNKKWNRFNKLISDIIKYFKKNKISAYAIAATAVMLIVVIIILIGVSKKNREDGGNVVNLSENAAVSTDGNVEVTQQALQQDAYPDVTNFVALYLSARASDNEDSLRASDVNIDDIELVKIRVTSEYIENYENVSCYTKPGPYDNSYIVYAVYDVKLYNWDVLAPALMTLLVCTDEEGGLYIYSGNLDENIANYISQVSEQTDVKDLMTKIDAQYHEVLDENIEYSDYITEINQTIKDAVGQELAAAAIIEDTEDEEPETTAEDALATFEVKVTDTVNVRASDSEFADKVDQVTAGTILNCYEQQANGWSKVDFNGEIAYISSQYLERLDFEEVDESTAIGTVKIKETVNIRSEANTDSTILGAGYAGETYPQLAEDENGWTKIIYNGREAYVKSEYLD